METVLKPVRGIMKGGVAVPELESQIPDGAPVEITVRYSDIPADVREEFEQWQQLRARAWGLIDEWEQEDQK